MFINSVVQQMQHHMQNTADCTEARFATGLIGQALINSPGDKLTGFGPLTGTNALTTVNVELTQLSGTLGDTLSSRYIIPNHYGLCNIRSIK